MTTITSDAFAELIGNDLSGVVFVRDYLQLEFNPLPRLNAYTPVTVNCGEQTATFGESNFANLIVGQIGKVVTRVVLRLNEGLEILFEDGSTVVVSLCPEHRGSEAIVFRRKDRTCIVI